MRQLKITKQVTNRETASLDKYLQEIGRVDLITAEEEVELARNIKAGDQETTNARLGCVFSPAAAQNIVSMVKEAVDGGAELLLGDCDGD